MLCMPPRPQSPALRQKDQMSEPPKIPASCLYRLSGALREDGHSPGHLAISQVCSLCCFLFIFGCAGSSLLHGLSSSCGERGPLFTVLCGFLIVVGPLAGEYGLQQLWHEGSVIMVPRLWSTGSILSCTGLAVPQHGGSSQTRDRTGMSCTAMWIPNHWTTRESLAPISKGQFVSLPDNTRTAKTL